MGQIAITLFAAPTVGSYVRPGTNIWPTRRVKCYSYNRDSHGIAVVGRGASDRKVVVSLDRSNE